MSEYIKKEDALFKKWQFKFKDVDGEHWFVNVKDIESLPTYSFPDREKGEWTKSCTCSNCGKWKILESERIDGKFKFCPNCGASMKGDKE